MRDTLQYWRAHKIEHHIYARELNTIYNSILIYVYKGNTFPSEVTGMFLLAAFFLFLQSMSISVFLSLNI